LITQASEIADKFFFIADDVFELMEVGRGGIDEHAAAITVDGGGDALQAPIGNSPMPLIAGIPSGRARTAAWENTDRGWR
jgi:hypothetical protein